MGELKSGRFSFLPSTYNELVYVDNDYANSHDTKSDLALYDARVQEFFGNVLGIKYDLIIDYTINGGKRVPGSCLIKKGSRAWIMKMSTGGRCATLEEVKI